MTPLVVVPGRLVGAGRAGRMEAVTTATTYLDALRRAGAEGVVIRPRPITAEEALALLNRADGLLVIGGQDVDPRLYDEKAVDQVYGVRREEDEFEMALLRSAIENDVPALAICRGAQVLNVALGGTLHQHVEGEVDHIGPGFPTRPPHTVGPVITVSLEPGSRVAKAVGAHQSNGTHLHHQTLARLGRGLKVTGRTDDGTIEAVEHERGWVVGVQWHPEDTAASDPDQQRLFDAFVSECRTRHSP
ncbi:MAG TPA: gamma-glutamyl-gamma-aminobutyrate hydrolase family protein [Acidimicrobiia bacterium]|nr:gamma-glutamyl-gamma-aminobutyrate hydrolase family protein [Acidimicrobiia bacterium]